MLRFRRAALAPTPPGHRSPARAAVRCRGLQPVAVRRLALLSIVLIGSACGRDDAGPVVTPPSTVAITVDVSRLQLVQLQTRQAIATVTGTTNTGVTWSSATPSIATVSQTGLITAITGGETSITATSIADPTRNASLTVIVAFRVNVFHTLTATEIYVGGTLPGALATTRVTATVTGDANTAVTWTSSNPAVASVDASGLVTALNGTPSSSGAPATATVTSASVADPTRSASSTFTVYPAPTTGTAVVSGTAVTDLSGATGDLKLYRLYVAPGLANLAVTTSGGGGDLDVYIRRGVPITRPPATNAEKALYSCVSEGPNSSESCNIPNPPAGHYYILLASFENYSGVTLLVKTTP